MNSAQARADVKRRLTAAGVSDYTVKAKTLSFEGFGYGTCVFVYVETTASNGLRPQALIDAVKQINADVPKPSAGGYIVKLGRP